MLPTLRLLISSAAACLLLAACGGGNSLVPKVATPAANGGNPAVARTPLGQTGRPAAPTQPALAPPTATQPPAPASVDTYTVVAGDTPNAIANKLNVASDRSDAWVAQLLSMNNTTASGLQIGQVLKLPPGGTTGGAPPAPGPGLPPANATRAPNASPVAGAPVIVQLTSPIGREQEGTLRVKAAANQGCNPTHLLANGSISGDDGLGPKTADAGGNLSWTFVVPKTTPTGEGSMRVICAGNVVAAPLVVN